MSSDECMTEFERTDEEATRLTRLAGYAASQVAQHPELRESDKIIFMIQGETTDDDGDELAEMGLIVSGYTNPMEVTHALTHAVQAILTEAGVANDVRFIVTNPINN